MALDTSNTYWSKTGKHDRLARKLRKLVPAVGSVMHPRKNRALEKFRKASNCYYDLYNNGLCNRVAEFRKVFGISTSHYKMGGGYGRYFQDMYNLTEEAMDKIVLAAATEQNVTIADDMPFEEWREKYSQKCLRVDGDVPQYEYAEWQEVYEEYIDNSYPL